MEVDPSKTKRLDRLKELARSLTQVSLPHVDAGTIDHYVTVDEPSRTSYKLYDWLSPRTDESIWLLGGGKDPQAIEHEDSELIAALKKKRYFHRLVFPVEIRDRLLSEAKKVKE